MVIHPGLIYFAGIFCLLFWKKTRKFFVLAIPLLALIQILFLKPGTVCLTRFFDLPITFFYVDKLSLFMSYIFALIGLLIMVYSLKVKENLHFILSFLYIAASLGVVFAGDYLTFFIFWEIMALAPTFLIWLGQASLPLRVGATMVAQEESLKAGYRYLVYHATGGLFLLAGILIEYISVYLSGGITSGPLLITTPTTKLSFSFILIGIGVNAAFIPFHTWLPDAYPKASFPASVLMSVYTTKTAIYALARIFPGVNLLAYIGALMAIYGVTLAVMQNEMRKLLSYHIISQVGYMVAAIGLGGDLGVNGGLFHAFNNILYKSLLFMCAGAVIYRLGEERLSNLGDLFKKMPITTFTALIASFSIAGLPLFNGFISKTIIGEVAHETHNYTVYLILKLASVGTWLSFLKFTYFGFLRKTTPLTRSPAYHQLKEVPWNMSLPMLIVALLCFLSGIYPKLVIGLLPYPLKEMHFYSGHNLFSAAQIYLVTLLIFWLSKEYFAPHKIVTLDFDYFYKKIAYSFIWLCKKVIAPLDEGILSVLLYFSRKIFYSFVRLCKKVIAPLDTGYTSGLEKLIPYARESWGITAEEGRVEKVIKNGGGLIVQTSQMVNSFERDIIDGMVNRIGQSALSFGRKLRRIQTGRLQNYAVIIFLALLVLILFLLIF